MNHKSDELISRSHNQVMGSRIRSRCSQIFNVLSSKKIEKSITKFIDTKYPLQPKKKPADNDNHDENENNNDNSIL